MKGWTPEGKEIELLPWQKEVVLNWIAFRDNRVLNVLLMPMRGRAGGKSVVTATISRLERNKTETGEWFPEETR